MVSFLFIAINCGAPTRPVEKPSLLETPLITEGHQSYQKGCYARRGLCWKDTSCFGGILQGFWSKWVGFHGSRIQSWAMWKVQTISSMFLFSPGRTVFGSTCIQGILVLASYKPFIIPGWILSFTFANCLAPFLVVASPHSPHVQWFHCMHWLSIYVIVFDWHFRWFYWLYHSASPRYAEYIFLGTWISSTVLPASLVAS